MQTKDAAPSTRFGLWRIQALSGRNGGQRLSFIEQEGELHWKANQLHWLLQDSAIATTYRVGNRRLWSQRFMIIAATGPIGGVIMGGIVVDLPCIGG